MGLLALVAATYFMVAGGPYGIEDILGGAGYRGALLILALLPLVWTLPTTLMIAELASALPVEGGFYVWVERALGPFWGYQEAWLSLSASVFDMAIYPTLFVLYLGRLAPGWTAGWHALAWELALVLGCCLWNLRGAASVGRGSVATFVLLLSPFVALTGIALWRGWTHPALHGIWTQPPVGGVNPSTAVLVAMWNYMGWDNASTIAAEVDSPAEAYPRAMLIAAAVVALSYMLPLAAIASAGIAPDQFTTGAWMAAARTLGGPLLGVAVVLGGMLNGLGMFNALTLSYTRLPVALAEDGMLPRWLKSRSSNGVPWAAIVSCGAAWALALGFSYERLISIDLILYGSSLVLEFAALLTLRVREPELERPFRMGSIWMAGALSMLPTALVGYAIWASREERMEMPGHISAVLFGVLVASLGPVLYWLSRRLWQHSRA